MYQSTKKDMVWGWVFLALPVLILIAGMIPGIMEVFYWDAKFYTTCSLLTLPEGTEMRELLFPVFSCFAYWIICGIVYYKKQGNGILAVYLTLGCACAIFLSFGLLMDGTHLHPLIKPMPYCLLPIACLVTALLAAVRMVLVKLSRRS